MASLSITVPDGEVNRIVAAFEVRFGPKGGLTAANFMAAQIKNYVKSVVRDVESAAAAVAAGATVAADVETDIP